MKNKIVAIHQPYFIPWIGFFDKISRADTYIVLGSVKCDYRNVSTLNRNKIKTPTGAIWLTVPIHASIHTKISDVRIDNSRNWQKDHLKTLTYNYKKALHFSKIYEVIEQIYSQNHEKLIALNMELIKSFMNLLNIKTQILYDHNLVPKGHKNDLLIDLVKKVNGTIYLSGQGGRDYLDRELFQKNNLETIFQDYETFQYSQLWGDFIPNLSIIDYLFNDGRPLG